MIYTIEVTPQDIDAGKRRSCDHCPIALALARTGIAFQGVDYSLVLGPDFNPIDLPQSARNFIEKFDEGAPVLPFTFTLDIPERP